MTCINHLYEELVNDFKSKLQRDLTPEEKKFLKWVEQKQIETLFKDVKSS